MHQILTFIRSWLWNVQAQIDTVLVESGQEVRHLVIQRLLVRSRAEVGDISAGSIVITNLGPGLGQIQRQRLE